MKWWNDLWLNEGFASYIKYAGVNAVHPDWDVMSDFVSQDLTSALHKDAHISSHPIIQQVFSANQINEIFDGISYKKVNEDTRTYVTHCITTALNMSTTRAARFFECWNTSWEPKISGRDCQIT